MTDTIDGTSGMQGKDTMLFHIGDLVRYTRTGTVGEIIEIVEENGEMFAELGSTNLLYRVDTLTPISAGTLHKKQEPHDQDLRREIETEIEKAAADALHDATTEIDSACSGGG